jgi:hypothetical protein
MGLAEIVAEADKVIESIRDYSRSQKELWRRVPLLALEADGRSGYCDSYSMAYRQGFWPLAAAPVYVDLASGELLDAYAASGSISICDLDVPKDSVIKPARNADVLRLAHNPGELDATRLIRSLEEHASQAYPSYYKAEEQETWRRKRKAELNLAELYVR